MQEEFVRLIENEQKNKKKLRILKEGKEEKKGDGRQD